MAANFNGCLTINNVSIAPVKYDPTLSVIDAASSGLNDFGYMTREIVRRNVAKISVEWSMLTSEEFEALVAQLEQDEFTVVYYYGTYKTAQMYCKTLSSSMQHAVSDTDVRWQLSCTLEEY